MADYLSEVRIIANNTGWTREVSVVPRTLVFSTNYYDTTLRVEVVNDDKYSVSLSDKTANIELKKWYDSENIPGDKLYVVMKKAWEIINDDSILSDSSVTEEETESKRRIGQGKLRDELFKFWNNRCPITGVENPDLLIASHIKPWKDGDNEERLSVYNAILLEARFDKLFDKGYISFTDEGDIIISQYLSKEDRLRLGLDKKIKIEGFKEGHKRYLEYHRENVFKGYKIDS